jgi:hypothetical protein
MGELRGQFILTEEVFQRTRQALISFGLAGIHDGGHEGIVFWAGREVADATVYLTAIIPEAQHSPQRVIVSKSAFARAAQVARSAGLGILCQVHSHPGRDTRHSDGDDHLIILPFEGMLSLVAPTFGIALQAITDFGVHQFQNGRWIFCRQHSVKSSLVKISSGIDLR